jgi:hypothetical protein
MPSSVCVIRMLHYALGVVSNHRQVLLWMWILTSRTLQEGNAPGCSQQQSIYEQTMAAETLQRCAIACCHHRGSKIWSR